MPHLTSKDGTSIGYEIVGSGPSVIVVEGATSYRVPGAGRPLAAVLGDRFTFVLYDRRGRGESGDTLPPSVDREIEDIAALADLVPDAPALLGYSSGGALALHAAAALGTAISRLAVYEPPYMSDDLLPLATQYTTELSAALADGRESDAVALFLARVGVPSDAIAGMKESPYWPGLVAIAPTLAYDDAAMDGSRIPLDAAARVSIPVLAMYGGASPEFMTFGARGVATAVPDGRLEVVADQAHDVAPSAIAPHLAAFLGA